MNHMVHIRLYFEQEIYKGEDTCIIIILKHEEHLHCWHIYGRIQTTRGRRKFYEQEQM